MLAGCRGTAWSEPRLPVGHGSRSGRRRVHGKYPASRAPSRSVVTADRPAPGPLSALACADLRRDRRPGRHRRDAAQRRPDGARRARDPVRRAARDGQDLARPDPREGAQLHGPPGRRPVRPLPVVRRDPRGPRAGRDRDRRRVQPRHRRHPRPPRALAYAPADLRRKVYILDEAHQITKDAWNALLKSLEEPPDFVTFMFASTHPQEFPPAILSRLQRFDVRRLTVPEIRASSARILEADGRTADARGAST